MLADEVFAWLSGLPDWQRDLARRLSGQVDLVDEEYDTAMLMVRHSFGLTAEHAPAPEPLLREHIAAGADGDDVRLLALGALRGVGLVGEEEELTFGEAGLTIVYGQNGAGKSTYVRVLKKLCRTVDRDCEIRGSIYVAPAPAPRAHIRFKVNGVPTEQPTSLEPTSAARVAGMSVFDSACAELYVDGQNAVQYIPSELRLLARLATLQDRMRQDLTLERNALQRHQPSLAEYPAETQVGRAVRTLTGGTTDPDLADLARLDGSETARLAELRRALITAQTSTAQADAAAAEREAHEAAELANELEGLAGRGQSTATDLLSEAVIAHREAQEALRIATDDLQGRVPGVGGGPWQVMWDAARAFVESADGGTFPPAVGATCPLCLQAVSADAAARFVHFQDHVTGTVRAAATAREDILNQRLDGVSPLHADALRETPLLVTLRDREPVLAASVDAVVQELRADLAAISAAPECAKPTDVDVTSAASALREWGESRASHAQALKEADNAEALPGLRAELAELEAREKLAGDLATFQEWQKKLLFIAHIDEAHSALATNKITAAQRGMIEEGLAKALDAALTAELQQLSCSLPVRMTTQIAKAETSVGVRLLASDPPRVSEIASEGERRALALCFFFAELEVANDLGGIVLDDPVSSLDDERRLYIAKRLVAEARNRQVIVFTHDLPFVFELRSLAKKGAVPLHVQHVWRQGDDVGRVDEHPPFKTTDLRGRVNRLAEEVEGMRKNRPTDSDEAWRQVDGFYKRLRTSWERAVEERLFGGVVERFERDVKTLQLRYVKVTPERIKQVEDGMSRGSRFVHEDAFAAQVSLPSVDEMAAAVAELRAFEQDTRPAL